MNVKPWHTILWIQCTITLLVWGWAGTVAVYGQHELVSSLTIDRGLVNNEVTSLCQDQYGFLWFGTRGGLNRYDGYEFKLIRNQPRSGNNFTSQYIEVIHEGASGNVWIGTKTSGLNRYDPLRDTIHHHVPPDSLHINIQNIQCLQEIDGQLYIGASSGLFGYDLALGSYYRITTKRNILSLLPDGVGLWVGTDQGLFHYNLLEKRLKELPWDVEGNVQITSIANDTQTGILYLGTWRRGVLAFHPATGRLVQQYVHEPRNPYSLSDNNAYRVFLDDTRNLWIGTWGGGLNRLEIKRDAMSRFPLDQQDGDVRQNQIVLSIMQDRSGILWVGTDGGGVYKVDPGRKRFNNIDFASHAHTPVADAYVRSIYTDEQGIWVGTRANGLYLSTNKRDFKKVPTVIDIKSVRGFFEHGQDLWVCTDQGIIVLEQGPAGSRQLAVVPERGNPESLSGPKINMITRDRDGIVWVGTQESGLNKVIGFADDGKPRFKQYPAEPGKDGALQNERISCMFSDSQGRLWIGTYNGLHLYNHAHDRFTVYQQRNGDPASLTNNTVLCINEDPNGSIWIGTQHGFNRLVADGDGTISFENHFAQNGFPNDYVHAIEPDKLGNLWMSTNSGIVKYAIDNGEFHNFDTRDGLISNIFSENSSFVSNEGEISFGSIKGVTSFFPDSISLNTQIPPVYITGITINNEDVTAGDTIAGRVVLSHVSFETHDLTLSYQQNIITFSFSALDYHAPDKNQYLYRLSGFDQDWVYSGDRRHATYTNLPPGNYTFTVLASNSDKAWNKEGTSITIKILPPPWKTWWAYSIYIALLIGFLWLSRHIGISRIKLRNKLEIANLNYQREQEITQVKSRLFTNVSHEFRTPLTLMMGPLSELTVAPQFDPGTRGTLNRILNQAKRLLHLVNQLLAVQKVEASNLSLHVGVYDVISVIRYVTDSFIDEADRRNIGFSIDAPAQLTFSFDKEKIEIVLFNLLSNAFKFTPDSGRIRLVAGLTTADTGDPYCEVTVDDTGCGIPEDEQHKIFDRFYQAEKGLNGKGVGSGIGLAFARELVGLHGGRITVESTPGTGSIFRIGLPAIGLYTPEMTGNNTEVTIANKTTGNDVQQPGFDATNRPTVLVVEDNDEIRDYIAMVIGSFCNVIQAENGERGMETAAEAIPDLIISDVMMPTQDGFGMCQQLKSDPRTSHIPVILLTARSDDDAYVEGIDKGADVYLTKPFNPQVLKSYVKNLIALRQRLREQFARYIHLEPDEQPTNTFEEEFIKRIASYTEAHLTTPDFNTDVLADVSNMSRSTFYRKLKAITGLSGSEFIKLIRLKHSASLLKSGNFNITQAAYEAGFNDLKHFRKSFLKQFGLTPSDYLKQHKTTIDL